MGWEFGDLGLVSSVSLAFACLACTSFSFKGYGVRGGRRDWG